MTFASTKHVSRPPFAVAAFAIMAGLLPAVPAAASQTAYDYDALGRLVRVSRSGGTPGYEARYAYDKADNRLNYTVTAAVTGVAVVPLHGYKIIPLGK